MELKNNSRIFLRDILLGILKMLHRIPAIVRYRFKISKIDSNKESWGAYLEKTAEKYPQNSAIKSENSEIGYQQYNYMVNRFTHFLLSRGIKKKDILFVMVENRMHLFVVIGAIAKIGAIATLIDTGLRNELLIRALKHVKGDGFIIGEEVFGDFYEIQMYLGLTESQKKHRYFLPDKNYINVPDHFIDLRKEARSASSSNPACVSDVLPEDILAYIFTSSKTVDAPKAAIITHKRMITNSYFNGKIVLNVKPGDTIYSPLPFFHTNSITLSWPAAVSSGATIAIRREFNVKKFWGDIKRYHANIFCYTEQMCNHLLNTPPVPEEYRHTLRVVIGNGLRPEIWHAFKQRFKIAKIYEAYSTAETHLSFINILNLDETMGVGLSSYAIVKFDESKNGPVKKEDGFMQKVPIGEVGLLIGQIGKTIPFATGYTDSQQYEQRLMHDVFAAGDTWFNTGDLACNMGYRHAQFVRRLGDTFNWKCEKVTSSEVEAIANTYTDINASLVYGVDVPGTGRQAEMIALIPKRRINASLDMKEMLNYFKSHLPNDAIPKFVRICKDFQTPPTLNSIKVKAKKEGYNVKSVSDPLFVLSPEQDRYTPLTEELHSDILMGKQKLLKIDSLNKKQ